ncbi:hypothetical protein J6590_062256 [Homalodisca vitripennis]|nr:hypothetical protein J6590_062256 [Homalodisca vitripennis]
MLGNSEIFPASSIVVMNVLPCVSTHFERQYIIVSNMYKQGSDKNSSSLNARDRSDRSFCSLKSLRKAAFPQLPHNVISSLCEDDNTIVVLQRAEMTLQHDVSRTGSGKSTPSRYQRPLTQCKLSSLCEDDNTIVVLQRAEMTLQHDVSRTGSGKSTPSCHQRHSHSNHAWVTAEYRSTLSDGAEMTLQHDVSRTGSGKSTPSCHQRHSHSNHAWVTAEYRSTLSDRAEMTLQHGVSRTGSGKSTPSRHQRHSHSNHAWVTAEYRSTLSDVNSVHSVRVEMTLQHDVSRTGSGKSTPGRYQRPLTQ